MTGSNVPLYEADYLLKHIRFHQLDLLQQLAFDLAFPGFRGTAEPTATQKKEIDESCRTGHPVYWQNVPARRYAGDHTLPGNRYHTLPRSRVGDDANTLLMELLAYHNPASGGSILAADLATPGAAKALTGDTDRAYQAIIVSFLSWRDQISPLWSAADGAGLGGEVRRLNQRTSNPDETYVPIVLPYELTRESISRVVDLRYPLCQEWFLHAFGASPLEKELKEDPRYVYFSSFAEMLPSLLDPRPGGTTFEGKSQHIGNWLRRHGVAALVYPSARANAAVHFVDGELTDHRGWNLVDYRNAPSPELLTLDMSFLAAPTGLPEGVRIVLPPPDETGMRGSFVVQGLAEWHVARLNRNGGSGILDLK